MCLFDVLNMDKLTLFNISEKHPSIFNLGFVGLLITGALFMIAGYLLPKQMLTD